MNYYRRYVGDYLGKTMRLSTTEHGAYSLLLDFYYAEEQPIPATPEEIYVICRAIKAEDRRAVDTVLKRYFVKRQDGYHNSRADKEIATAKQARINGAKGGRPITGIETETKTETETGLITEEGGGSLHPPTTNHQPPAFSLQPLTRQPSTKGKKCSAAPRASAPSGTETWEAYATAYLVRYKMPPVRNATVNACIVQFVKRIGIVEAPQVAAFYVGHNNAFYVRKGHSVSPMLSDAEKLRTEWATGRKITGLEARSAEQKDAVREQVKRVAENMEKDHGRKE